MSVREYIGARYVPLFADPIEWDNTKTYEPLTIVYYQGNSYTSRQAVPTGIAITNETYWALTGNYNAQIEAYREEVQNYSESVAGVIEDVEDIETDITGLDGRLDAIEANGWVTTARIADESVTTAKLDDGSVTNVKIANNTITKDKLVNDDIFLIFGDSWCNFVDHPDWSVETNEILGCGQILNYGVGASSFTGASTIYSQITSAISELTTAQKNNVKYIVIMAGVNDFQPNMPTGFLDAVETCMKTCVTNFPHAKVQWFPTTCTPDYGSATKWLMTIAAFWYFISKKAGNSTTNKANKYCFPSCGPAFYFNNESAISTFFDNTKLHLNTAGKNAIVNAVLEGFGELNVPYQRSWWFNRGSGHRVQIQITPNSVKMNGEYQATGDISFGNQGAYVLVAMAAMQCMEMCDNAHGPHFMPFPSVGMSSGVQTHDYCGIWPHNDFQGADFGVPSNYTADTLRYIMV